jgi:hypothetical protein
MYRALRDASAGTILLYLWLSDKTTSAYDEDGTTIGVVMFGNDIPFSVIADENNLRYHWSTIQSNMQWLCDRGLVRRKRGQTTEGYRFEVVGSARKVDEQSTLKTARKLKGETYYKKDKPVEPSTDDIDESKKPGSFDDIDDEPEIGDMRDWAEARHGVSGERLRNCIIYQLDHAKDAYIRNSGITVASMRRPKFIKLLNEKTPPGWTPNKGKVETDDERETREYYERIERLKQLKDMEGLCKCGSSDFACKCVSAAYHAEMEAHA